MAEKTGISWTDSTFNHVRGCSHVSPGCERCYAETLAKRNPDVLGTWGAHGRRVVAAESYWKQPERWNRQAEREGRRHRVFCASLADVFEDLPGWHPDQIHVTRARIRLCDLIETTPALDWLLLTKRPQNIMHMTPATWASGFPANVWVGTSVEDRRWADERIPWLLKVPAVVRFLSAEPLLGPLDLRRWVNDLHIPSCMTGDGPYQGSNRLNWVIGGGESGPNARPCHPDWARSLRDQCQTAGVPFFWKQWGEYAPLSALVRPETEEEQVEFLRLTCGVNRSTPEGTRYTGKDAVFKVGKKTAGHLLDGREHHEFPETPARVPAGALFSLDGTP